MELLLITIALSTVSGLVGRSAGTATRLVISLVAIAVTLTYAMYPRLM